MEQQGKTAAAVTSSPTAVASSPTAVAPSLTTVTTSLTASASSSLTAPVTSVIFHCDICSIDFTDYSILLQTITDEKLCLNSTNELCYYQHMLGRRHLNKINLDKTWRKGNINKEWSNLRNLNKTYNPDTCCGVLHRSEPCMFRLDCTRPGHGPKAKRQVEGRSKDFDTLLEEHITTKTAFFRNKFNSLNAAINLSSLTNVPSLAKNGTAVTSLASTASAEISSITSTIASCSPPYTLNKRQHESLQTDLKKPKAKKIKSTFRNKNLCCNLDIQCGVLCVHEVSNNEAKEIQCENKLDCRTHNLELKRQVKGRSKDFDTLKAEQFGAGLEDIIGAVDAPSFNLSEVALDDDTTKSIKSVSTTISPEEFLKKALMDKVVSLDVKESLSCSKQFDSKTVSQNPEILSIEVLSKDYLAKLPSIRLTQLMQKVTAEKANRNCIALKEEEDEEEEEEDVAKYLDAIKLYNHVSNQLQKVTAPLCETSNGISSDHMPNGPEKLLYSSFSEFILTVKLEWMDKDDRIEEFFLSAAKSNDLSFSLDHNLFNECHCYELKIGGVTVPGPFQRAGTDKLNAQKTFLKAILLKLRLSDFFKVESFGADSNCRKTLILSSSCLQDCVRYDQLCQPRFIMKSTKT